MRVWFWTAVVCGCVALGYDRAAAQQVETPSLKTAVTPTESGRLHVDAQHLAGAVSNQPSAVEAWMKHIQERNPEEFERLSKLRTDNPEAFRKVLKERLAKMRDGKLEDLPHVKVFLEKLPAEEREQFLKRLREGGSKMREEWSKHNASLAKSEQETRKLVAAYKKAGHEEQKKLRADLKKNVSESFELREKARQENIQRMESQLAKLKKDAEKRKADRESIVEGRLKELLADAQPPK
jgi:flagellar capping protein FliD